MPSCTHINQNGWKRPASYHFQSRHFEKIQFCLSTHFLSILSKTKGCPLLKPRNSPIIEYLLSPYHKHRHCNLKLNIIYDLKSQLILTLDISINPIASKRKRRVHALFIRHSAPTDSLAQDIATSNDITLSGRVLYPKKSQKNHKQYQLQNRLCKLYINQSQTWNFLKPKHNFTKSPHILCVPP